MKPCHWVHRKFPRSTVKAVLASYESKTGCNRTPTTVLWVPLNYGGTLNPSLVVLPASGYLWLQIWKIRIWKEAAGIDIKKGLMEETLKLGLSHLV